MDQVESKKFQLDKNFGQKLEKFLLICYRNILHEHIKKILKRS